MKKDIDPVGLEDVEEDSIMVAASREKRFVAFLQQMLDVLSSSQHQSLESSQKETPMLPPRASRFCT